MRCTRWLVLVGILCLTTVAQTHEEKDIDSIVERRQGEASKTHKSPKFEFATAHQIPYKHRPKEDKYEFSNAAPIKEKKLIKLSELKEKKIRSKRETEEKSGLNVKIEAESEKGVVDETYAADSDEIKILARKAESSVKKLEKKDSNIKTQTKHTAENVKVNLEADTGVNIHPVASDSSVITVPKQKNISPNKQTDNHFEVISVNQPGDKRRLTDEGTFDFVDTPLSDKPVVPSGSSRVAIRKGPGGVDYEYEYVYYYYDDDEDNATAGKGTGSSTARTPTTLKSTTVDTISNSVRGRSRGAEHDETSVRSNGRTRYTTIERNRPADNAALPTTPEPASNEVLPPQSRGSRFRGRQLQQPVEPTVAEERLPANTRFPPRSRAASQNANSVTTTPAQTDTPITRIRGSSSGSVRRPSLELVDSSSFRTHSSDVSPDQDHSPNGSDIPESIARGQGRSSRVRPSPPAEDTLSVAVIPSYTEGDKPADNTRESDLEEYVNSEVEPKHPSLVPKSTVPLPAETEGTTEGVATTAYTAGMTDKAAFDLYALLRETQNEESNLLTDEPSTTDIAEETETTAETETTSTTQAQTTIPVTTTTTTTTTPEPTTTQPPAPTGRGRYRIGNGGTRNRFRNSGSTTTTTTTENPEDTTPKRTRFQPSHSRVTGQVSAYGRRGSKTTAAPDLASSNTGNIEATPRTNGRGRYRSSNRVGGSQSTTTTTEASVSSPASSQSSFSRPSFASDRYNLRRRGGPRISTTTVAPVSDSAKQDAPADSETGADGSTSATTTLRPTRPRLNIGGGARPLRPGPRINISPRGRLGLTPATTAAPAPVIEETTPQTETSEEPEQNEPAETTTPAPSDPLTRLRNRPRLRVTDKAPKLAPQSSPTNRRALVSGLLPRRRPGLPPVETSTENAEEKQQEENKEEEEEEKGSETTLPSSTTTTEAPQENNSRLSSLIAGRRRIGGRRPGSLLLSRPGASTVSEA